MGGGGKQTQTQSAEPWSAAQPYLKDVYSQAQDLYNAGGPTFWGGTANAPLTPEMQQAMGDIWSRATGGTPGLAGAQASTGILAAGGAAGSNPAYDYLMGQVYGGDQNPALGYATNLAGNLGTNPAMQYMQQEASGQNVGQNLWLDATYKSAVDPLMKTYKESTVPALQSDYALSGRYGSNAMRTALSGEQDKLGSAASDLATKIYGGAYAQDRQNQLAAQGQLSQAYNQGIQNQLGAGQFLSGVYDQGLQRQLYGAQQLGQLGQQDITNMLNAAGMVPQLGQANYTDLNAALGVAQAGQDRTQQEQDLERERYEYNQQLPYNWLQNYAQLIYGNPGSQSGFGTTTSTTKGGGGGVFGQVLSGLTGLASIASRFSDRRVKTDVTRVGTLDNDLPVYAYRYLWGGPVEIGVMAQDVEKVHPEAVGNVWGIKTVDYARATA